MSDSIFRNCVQKHDILWMQEHQCMIAERYLQPEFQAHTTFMNIPTRDITLAQSLREVKGSAPSAVGVERG